MKKTIGLVVFLVTAMTLTGCQSIYDDGGGKALSREMEFRSMGIVTDNDTGCQYILIVDGGITPRLTADGKQYGCR